MCDAKLAMEDSHYYQLFVYLRTSEFPSGFTKIQRDSLRRRSQNFVVKDGLLHYRNKKKMTDLQVRLLIVMEYLLSMQEFSLINVFLSLL